MRMHRPLTHAAWLSAALIGLIAGPVLAESACKGLAEAQCAGQTGCSWTAGYTRKDGKAVSGYCKSVGKRDPAAAKVPATAPAANDKTPATGGSVGPMSKPPAKAIPQ